MQNDHIRNWFMDNAAQKLSSNTFLKHFKHLPGWNDQGLSTQVLERRRSPKISNWDWRLFQGCNQWRIYVSASEVDLMPRMTSWSIWKAPKQRSPRISLCSNTSIEFNTWSQSWTNLLGMNQFQFLPTTWRQNHLWFISLQCKQNFSNAEKKLDRFFHWLENNQSSNNGNGSFSFPLNRKKEEWQTRRQEKE